MDIDREEPLDSVPLPFWKVCLWVALYPIVSLLELGLTIADTAKMVLRNRH